MKLKGEDKSSVALTVGSLTVLGSTNSPAIKQVQEQGKSSLYSIQAISGSLENLILEISSDGIISPGEKKILVREMEGITAELSVILAEATNAGVDEQDIWNYQQAYLDLYTLLYTTLQVFDDMEIATEIPDRDLLNDTFSAYADAQSTMSALIINAVRDGIVNGTDADYPDAIVSVTAKAVRDYIDISWTWTGTSLRNSVNRFIVEVSDDGVTWWTKYAKDNSYRYFFVRDADGYPEISSGANPLTGWRVRVRAENTYGLISQSYGPSAAGQAIDTSAYLTWIPPVPVVSPYCNGRQAVLSWGAGGQYGRAGYEAQIARKDTAPDEADWVKPILTLDPRSAETAYSDGTTGVLFTTVEQLTQALPLHNQSLGLPVDTIYYYRVRGVTAVPTSAVPDAVINGAWSGAYPVLARPTGTMDLVEKAIKTAQLDDDAVTVEKLNVLAKNLVNPFTGEALDAMPEGWTATGLDVCKISASAEIGYHVLEIKTAADGSGHVVSDEFTVGPYDILELTVALMSDVAANVSVRPGAPGDAAYQTYRSAWNATNKAWGAFGNLSSGQLLIENVSPIGAYVAYKTYIVGSLVDPTQIPAPINVQYCVRMVAGQTAMKIHVVSYLSVATVCVGIPTLLKLGAGQLTANQILVRDLSAISANVGKLEGDDPDAFTLVGNNGYDKPLGTFLLGKATDASYLRRWFDTATSTWKMAIKLATFFVDAVSSKILGAFEVKNTADTVVNLSVDGTTGATNVSGGGDVSLVAGSGRLLIGNKAGAHIAMDENEIMAKGNGTTPATLNLNAEGGLVNIGAGGMNVEGSLSAGRSRLANTFIDTGVCLLEQDGFLITTDIPSGYDPMVFLEFTMNSYFAGHPCIGIVQCYPYPSESALLACAYSAMGVAPPYCRIFFANDKLCFWLPKNTNYQTLHPVLHTNKGPYTITSTTAEALPASRSREVVVNVLLPWSSINDGVGSGLDADTLDGQHGSYYAPINSPALTGTPTIYDPTWGNISIARVNPATGIAVLEYPLGTYIAVYDSTGANRERNSAQTVYVKASNTRDYTFNADDSAWTVNGTWRCCGVSGYVSTSTKNYLMRRIG